ncbi:MAG: HAD-IA family hydrolase [Synechococcaceae cyanobacterium]|nr:HAD-IA family hydrolase [Synechococcaceae cyanobacterium]
MEAVLFDKDGTLSHSEPMLQALGIERIAHCLQLIRRVHPRKRTRNLETLLRRAYGLSEAGVDPAGALAVAARDHNLVATATALAQEGLGWPEAHAIAEEAFLRSEGRGEGDDPLPVPPPTDGLGGLLQALRGAGVRCGVISNDGEAGIRSFLRRHDLNDHFAALWSADHRPRKPDPAAVHGLCRVLGVPPRRCALVGDANSDLHMARLAGVAVVLGYRAGWQRPVPLDASFPHVDHWRELAVVARCGE